MSILTNSVETANYLDALTPHLAHLAEDDRIELLEELAIHLDSVLEVAEAAGDERNLRLIVGEPALFVRDYCESAGLPASALQDVPTDSPGPISGLIQHTGRGVSWFEDRVLGRDALRSAINFMPELRPMWWVVRGILTVMIVGQVLGFDGVDRWWFVPVPKLFGSVPFGLLVAIWAVRKSVEIGRRGTRSKRGLVANILIAFFGFIIVGTHLSATNYAWAEEYPAEIVTADDQYVGSTGGNTYLRSWDGQLITNIYPLDESGQLIEGVRLFDQQGRPIDNISWEDPANYGHDGVPEIWTPVFEQDAAGNEVTNSFPRVNRDGLGSLQLAPQILVPMQPRIAPSPIPARPAEPVDTVEPAEPIEAVEPSEPVEPVEPGS